ncbi:transcriptional regulator [Halocatena pleomorpha]|uniref:Transcriptional regulator n=1 Tax=Halocatena pleomorpha TaxID=1785090 RepID=A0A3P3R453_9EURY|nr:transcriptional regulator [Halocatena pleomorpha]RRJ28257.1 transcriptional regulator [Halocatena pleomorpha]
MQGERETTRQQIAARIRNDPSPPGVLASEFAIPCSVVLSHVEHLAQSLRSTDEQLLAAPPECRECGFSEFDDIINRPSRCPNCKSENVDEPVFTID